MLISGSFAIPLELYMLPRFHNWTAQLENYIRAHRDRKFKYGRFDCCLMCADAIQTMTGTDIAAEFRGRYSTRTEALHAIAEITGKLTIQSAAEHAARAHRLPEIPTLMASRGDMVLIKRPRDYSMGIVAMNGREIHIALARGIGMVPLSSAVRAWRV